MEYPWLLLEHSDIEESLLNLSMDLLTGGVMQTFSLFGFHHCFWPHVGFSARSLTFLFLTLSEKTFLSKLDRSTSLFLLVLPGVSVYTENTKFSEALLKQKKQKLAAVACLPCFFLE